MKLSTSAIPENCPADLTEPPAIDIGDEALLDLGISLDEHWGLVPEAVSRPDSLKAQKVITGQLACRLCDYQDECAQAVEIGKNSGLVERDHPLEIEEMLTPHEKAMLWANAAVRTKAEQGYTLQSVASMAGAVAKLPKPLMDIVVEMLKADGVHGLDISSMPEQLGTLHIDGKEHTIITWSGSRLIVSQTVIDAIEGERKKGSVYGSYKVLIDNFSTILRSCDTDIKRSYISEFVANGGNLRELNVKKLQDRRIFEFNAATHSMVRIFGDILETPRSLSGKDDEGRVTTLFLPGATDSAKSGEGNRLNRLARGYEGLALRIKELSRKGDLDSLLLDIDLNELVKR